MIKAGDTYRHVTTGDTVEVFVVSTTHNVITLRRTTEAVAWFYKVTTHDLLRDYALIDSPTLFHVQPHVCEMVVYDTGFPNSRRFKYCKDRNCNKEEPL